MLLPRLFTTRAAQALQAAARRRLGFCRLSDPAQAGSALLAPAPEGAAALARRNTARGSASWGCPGPLKRARSRNPQPVAWQSQIRGPCLEIVAPTLAHCVWPLPPEGAAALAGRNTARGSASWGCPSPLKRDRSRNPQPAAWQSQIRGPCPVKRGSTASHVQGLFWP